MATDSLLWWRRDGGQLGWSKNVIGVRWLGEDKVNYGCACASESEVVVADRKLRFSSEKNVKGFAVTEGRRKPFLLLNHLLIFQISALFTIVYFCVILINDEALNGCCYGNVVVV
ncbi:hypothetical protein RYX36_012877 [Vicia faba]